MQCVILAAGEGKRLRPLTLERPKPLVLVGTRPIVEYVLDALPASIDEVLFVVGYKGEQIQAHFGDRYKGKRVRYVNQKEQLGTAHALQMVRPHLVGKFMVILADDIHGPRALAEAVEHDLCLVVAEHAFPERFGVVALTDDGRLAHIIEKPNHPPTNLVSTGVMVLDERIFAHAAERSESGEYNLPDMLTALAQEADVAIVRQDEWHPIGYPEDVARYEQMLRAL